MAKRKKRNAITLVSLLLALIALVGVYIWYSDKKSAGEENTEDTNSLATLDTENVTALHYIGSDVDMNLSLEDGVWKSKEEPDRPINQDNVTSILSAITTIKAYQEVVDAPEDLAEYGLDNPAKYIQATLKDGSTVTLKLGNEVITGDGYYAMVNDDTKVYLVDVSYESGLSFTNLDMTAMEKTPTITAENITYINVDNRESEDVELKLNDNIGVDNSGSNLYSWEILKPYGKGFTADTSKITTLQANYTSFSFNDCIDYTGADMDKYGLKDPSASIDIGYFETTVTPTPAADTDSTAATAEKINKEYKIYIGNKNEDGDYYVRSEGSNSVYTMTGSTVDKMLQIDVFSLLNLYVSLPNIDTVDKINADIEGTPYTMEIKRTSKTKADSEETEATYYYNGDKVEEDLFKSVYQTIVSAKYDAQLKEEVDTSKTKPIMTLSFHIFGDNETTISTSYLPYDDSFYIADKGNEFYFLVDKRVIDTIAKTIKTFSNPNE